MVENGGELYEDANIPYDSTIQYAGETDVVWTLVNKNT